MIWKFGNLIMLNKINPCKKIIIPIISMAHYLIISFILSSCAQISAPTGGERDKNPPKIKAENPANKTLNFNGKEIKIAFSEWIQPLTNPKNQIIISPNIDPFPKISIERNMLLIKFKENSLLPNTTYSLFFGDNIKDNNEGNAFSNFKYLFSTGSYIDSLQIKGKIIPADGKQEDNTYLVIYSDLSDTAFTKTRPMYATKIDNSGNFSLENVKEGRYKIYTLTDKNANYYYDLPTEKIGFTDSVIELKRNLDTLTIHHFLPEAENYRLTSTENTINGGILKLELNKPYAVEKDEWRVSLKEDSTLAALTFPQEDGNKLLIYFPNLKSDTGKYQLMLYLNNDLVDSLPVRITSVKWKTPQLFFTDTSAYKNLKVFEGKNLKLKAAYYTTSKPDTSKIMLTDSAGHNLPYEIHMQEDLSTLELKTDWKSGIPYKLTINDSALVDIIGNYNKKQDFSILGVSAKKGGNLLINIELPDFKNDYIAILSDNSGKVWDRRILRDSQALKIDYGLMPAGNYSLKIIDDKNNNGIENSGSYIHKILPEKSFTSKPLTIKENWDAEETVKADFSMPTIVPRKTNNESDEETGEEEKNTIKPGIKNFQDKNAPGKN